MSDIRYLNSVNNLTILLVPLAARSKAYVYRR
jgi:hypothetical protein